MPANDLARPTRGRMGGLLGVATPVAPTQQPPTLRGGDDWNAWYNQLLGGRNPFGSGGQINPGDPRYYESYTDEGGGNQYRYRDDVSLRGGPISGGRVQIGHGIDLDRIIDRNAVEYDPEFGVITRLDNMRDPDARSDMWRNALMMSVFGGAAAAGIYGAAGAAGETAGPGLIDFSEFGPMATSGGASGGGYTLAELPEIISAEQAAAGAAGSAAATGGVPSGTGDLWNVNGPPEGTLPDTTPPSNYSGDVPPGSGTPNGFNARDLLNYGSRGRTLYNLLTGGGNNSRGNNNMGTPNLLDLLLGGGAYAQGRNNINDFRGDINDMFNRGTGGVTNDDRAGARDLVRGVYDGSISGDEVFNRVPGLRAMSDRLAADTGRAQSKRGQGQPMNENAGWQREFSNYDNELISKAWNSEMDRASKIGGFDFNPGLLGAAGMRAAGDVYGARTNNDAALAALLGRGSGSNGTGGLNIQDLLRYFQGGGTPGSEGGETDINGNPIGDGSPTDNGDGSWNSSGDDSGNWWDDISSYFGF